MIFPVTFFPLVVTSLGRLFGTVERRLLSTLKIPFGGNFNFWYNTVKFSKMSFESMLVGADIYGAVSTDHPTVLSGSKLSGVFNYGLERKKLKTATKQCLIPF
jgi:hypothetical protein